MLLLKIWTRHRGLPCSQQCEAVSLCVWDKTERQYFAWLLRQRGPTDAIARQGVWCGRCVQLFLARPGRLLAAAKETSEALWYRGVVTVSALLRRQHWPSGALARQAVGRLEFGFHSHAHLGCLTLLGTSEAPC